MWVCGVGLCMAVESTGACMMEENGGSGEGECGKLICVIGMGPEGMVVVVALETVELLAVKMVRGGRQRGAMGRASLTVEVGAVVGIPMGRLGMSSDALTGHMSATAARAVATR